PRGDGPNGRGGGPPPGEGPGVVPNTSDFAPGLFVERFDASGEVIGTPIPARVPGGTEYTPTLPADVAQRPLQSGPGEPHPYLTVGSATPGGPAFRLRISVLASGGRLVTGLPLGDTTGT